MVTSSTNGIELQDQQSSNGVKSIAIDSIQVDDQEVRDEKSKLKNETDLRSTSTELLNGLPILTSLNQINSSDKIDIEEENQREEVEEKKKKDNLNPSSNSSFSDIIEKKYFGYITKRHAQITLSFLLIGLVGLTNESATGALLNSMQLYYEVSYQQISLVFLSNIMGYLISCLSAAFLTHHFSFSLTLLLAGLLQTLGSLTLALLPPFGVFIPAVLLLGMGSGLFEACLATVMSHEEDSILMSFYYSALAIGAVFSPIVVGSLSDKGFRWNIFYYVPLALTILFSLIAFPIFRSYQPPPDEIQPVEEEVEDELNGISTSKFLSTNSDGTKKVNGVKFRMKKALKLTMVWIGFALCFLSFGISDTISAWIVSYQITVHSQEENSSRYQLTAVWSGIAIGRILFPLAFGKIKTLNKLSDQWFSVIMCILTSGCLVIVWFINNSIGAAVALAGVGFFIGPLTPKALSSTSARVPHSIRGSVVSMTLTFGLAGACLGPLLFGVVASNIKNGINSLPVILIGSCVVLAAVWLLVPRLPIKKVENDVEVVDDVTNLV